MAENGNLDTSLVLILIGVIGMLLLAVAVIFFFIIYQKRLFAQQSKIKGMETAYQKELLRATVQAQEAERKRVATDLHDGVGSLLSAARLYVGQLSVQRSSAKFAEIHSEAQSIVDTAIQQTREISHNLLPASLDRVGVIKALNGHLNKIEKSSGLQVEFSYEEDYAFSKEQDLAVYRIVQELLNNTLKHAEAQSIKVHFETLENGVRLSYTDDGKGLNSAHQGAGLGMKSIESRVNLIGGKMEVKTGLPKGFQATFDLLAE